MRNEVPERREAAGLSQADLGAAVGVTRQTINAIERDRYDPSLELAMKLAVLFDCDVEALFDPDIDVTPLDEDT
ncbi:transcriptional regulator [Halobacteriales archaeon SW_12_69_24]|nr:MAG: transcriptional regulator [Halobacteriales archaeon QH_1_68_42]PSP96147.1 MAG: transcriptional regulator [Halobacteriales archaeon QH_8_68_33]PSQ33682.1 MAG: transcriptional regulator [Halobacteriales archaeon SW_12_69_24]